MNKLLNKILDIYLLFAVVLLALFITGVIPIDWKIATAPVLLLVAFIALVIQPIVIVYLAIKVRRSNTHKTQMHLVEIIEQLNKDIVTYEVALHISKRDHNKITAKAIQQNIDALTGIRNQLNALI